MSPDALRLLIADDEPLARALARQYARDDGTVEVVAEAATGDELAAELTRAGVDAALVDIRMPGEDVFSVLARRAEERPLPAVIFATAYDRYAVRAFELNAVDYLIKPYSADRFGEAIRRARRHRDRADAGTGLLRAIRDLGPRPDRVLVPEGRRMVPVAIGEITWIKAEGDFARVHVKGRSYLVSRSLKELEAKLDADRFVRIHRSAIVQTTAIQEVRAQGGSRYRLVLSDETVLIVSRTRAAQLKRLVL